MRVTVIASGSGGNALVIQVAGTSVLVDCGLPLRVLEKRMAAAGLALPSIDALLVTHEHTDHVRGLELLMRRHRFAMLATAGTARALGIGGGLGEIASGRTFSVGSLEVLPVATSHDAEEPVGFVFDDGARRIGVVTDTGTITRLLHERLAGCHALFLESNHDLDMLRLGPYPWPLKQRISSNTGHLSNEQTRDTLEILAHGGLQTVVAMHLSRENNHASLVRRELGRVLDGSGVQLAIAEQDRAIVVEVGRPPVAGSAALG